MSRGPETFFLTGCASGIGRYLANELVRRGFQVCAADIAFDALSNEAQARSWPAERTLLAELDVRDPDAWQREYAAAVTRFGRIDVCMNIAGILRSSWLHETALDEIQTQIDINTKGVIFGTQTACRYMIRQGAGHIINVASMAGIAPIPGLAVYTASKFAVRGFSIAAAVELRPHGVAVTVLCPDSVDTPLLDLPPDNEAAAMIFSGRRLLTLNEVGDAVFNHALVRRPMEIALPWRRSLLAKAGSLFPGLTMSLVPWLQRKGRQAHQQRVAPPR